MNFRQRLARRLDPELAEKEWEFEFLRGQYEALIRREPLCSLYRDGVFLGFAVNPGRRLLLISERTAAAFVTAHAADLDRPTGMVRALIFRPDGFDPEYDMQKFDFYEAR